MVTVTLTWQFLQVTPLFHKYGGEGRVFIYYGSGSGLGTTPVWQVGSDQQGAYTGLGMGHPGDFNNDGYDDLPVGAFGINTAYVYYGRALIGNLDAENSGPTELNQATYFTATLMGGEGGSVGSAWDFGDGTTASGVQVQHTYSTPGAFLARVTADNNISHAHTETTVTVFQPFTLEPGGGSATGDGLLSFPAPSGLSSSLVITYTPQSTLTHSSEIFQFAGLSFGLTVTDLSGNPVIVPNQPLTLVISYNEADLPPGVDENLLQLYRYNPVYLRLGGYDCTKPKHDRKYPGCAPGSLLGVCAHANKYFEYLLTTRKKVKPGRGTAPTSAGLINPVVRILVILPGWTVDCYPNTRARAIFICC